MELVQTDKAIPFYHDKPEIQKLLHESVCLSDQLFFHSEKKILLVRNTKTHKFRPFPISDILYIKSMGDYIKVFYGKSLCMSVICTMKRFTEVFGREGTNTFMRIHRLFVVNTEHMTGRYRLTLFLSYTNENSRIVDIEIPIGRVYKTNLHGTLLQMKSYKKESS